MRARHPAHDVRWHLHSWNRAALIRLARWNIDHFPRPLSEAFIRGGSWLAYHAMPEATAAVVDNLRVVAPSLGIRELRKLALLT